MLHSFIKSKLFIIQNWMAYFLDIQLDG